IKDGVLGRNFQEGDELYNDIPEKHYKILESELESKLSEDEIQILHEIVDIKRKQDLNWGIY
ncbi:MAG: translation initiation factor IF-2, partial [Methanobacteriaceae archaeon]